MRRVSGVIELIPEADCSLRIHLVSALQTLPLPGPAIETGKPGLGFTWGMRPCRRCLPLVRTLPGRATPLDWRGTHLPSRAPI